MTKINELGEVADEEDREKIISKLEEIVPTYKRFQLKKIAAECV
jgi:hypothetical protein